MTDATGTGHSARQRGGALVAGLLAVPLLAVAAPSALAAPADLYAVRQVAGAFVLLESGWASQYGGATIVDVTDIRSGRAYVVARSCFSVVRGGPCGRGNARAAAAFIGKRGQAAAAILPEGTQTTAIAGFTARGKRLDLDSGPSSELPASSLRLGGSTVSWTHSGEPRSAKLPGERRGSSRPRR